MTEPLRQPVTPHLSVAQGVAALEFYKRAFGAREMSRLMSDDGKRLMHAALDVNGGVFMLSDDFPEYAAEGDARPPAVVGGTPVAIHLVVDDVDAAFRRAVDAGATKLMEPMDMFWGDRYGKLRDPFGHVWSLGAPVKK